MPFKKGMKRPEGAGRKKNGNYKSRAEAACAKVGIDVFEYSAHVVANKVECGVCRGKGETPYQANGKTHKRKCESCYGSGLERISTRDRMDAAKFLGGRIEGALVSVEHSGADDKPPIGVRVVLVKADGSSA
jgi:DnaJ-class molecular chaperone